MKYLSKIQLIVISLLIILACSILIIPSSANASSSRVTTTKKIKAISTVFTYKNIGTCKLPAVKKTEYCIVSSRVKLRITYRCNGNNPASMLVTAWGSKGLRSFSFIVKCNQISYTDKTVGNKTTRKYIWGGTTTVNLTVPGKYQYKAIAGTDI